MSLLAYAGPATLAIMAFNALVVALTDVYDGSGHDLLRLLGLPSPVRAVLYALLSLGGVAALWMQRRNADLAFVGAVAVVCLWAYTAFALVVHGEDPAGDDACSRTTLYRAGFFAILGGMSLTYAIARIAAVARERAQVAGINGTYAPNRAAPNRTTNGNVNTSNIGRMNNRSNGNNQPVTNGAMRANNNPQRNRLNGA